MQKNIITIFTITYNCNKFINRCYQSILNQNYKDWIWLVIDDGSTDDTEIQFQSIIDSRIQYYRLTSNVGRGLARNFGLSKVQTRFIAILDIDDLMLHNRLEKFNSAISNNFLGLVSSTILIDSCLKITGLRDVVHNKYFNLFTHATLCIDVEILKTISYSNSRYAEDQRVILYVSKLRNIYRCEDPLYIYQEDASINVKGAFLSNLYAFINVFRFSFIEKKYEVNLKLIFYLIRFCVNAFFLFFVFIFPFGDKIYKKNLNKRSKIFYSNESISNELNCYGK